MLLRIMNCQRHPIRYGKKQQQKKNNKSGGKGREVRFGIYVEDGGETSGNSVASLSKKSNGREGRRRDPKNGAYER